MALTIDYSITSQNFFPSYQPFKAISLHGTSGSLDAALSWLCNPNSDASANFVVAKDGRIFCLVNPYQGKKAWANGIINNPDPALQWLADALKRDTSQVQYNINQYTISIEHEASASDMKLHMTPPDSQMQASLWLVMKLMKDFRLTPSSETLTFHSQYDSVNRPYCPGIFDRYDYINRLKALMSQNDPNPDHYNIGPGMLAKLAELNDQAASNEQYFSPNVNQPPGLAQRSFVYTKQGRMLLGLQDVDAATNKALPTWNIQVYKLAQ